MGSLPKRIGIHLATGGGAATAVERAHEIGANTFQIFSSSPRMWKAPKVLPEQARRVRTLRKEYDIAPAVVHASYLINVCSQNEDVRQKSIVAFRGEVERALALGCEFLVLHPGSWKGLTRDKGLELAAASITEAIAGQSLEANNFQILIENTAGAEFSLGGSFEQVAELVERLRPFAPMGVCLDTCHTHVAGYDIVSESGYEATIHKIAETVGLNTVRVWHCNDAKAVCGSRLDRHENIGLGTIGLEPFRRLLNDSRFCSLCFHRRNTGR